MLLTNGTLRTLAVALGIAFVAVLLKLGFAVTAYADEPPVGQVEALLPGVLEAGASEPATISILEDAAPVESPVQALSPVVSQTLESASASDDLLAQATAVADVVALPPVPETLQEPLAALAGATGLRLPGIGDVAPELGAMTAGVTAGVSEYPDNVESGPSGEPTTLPPARPVTDPAAVSTLASVATTADGQMMLPSTAGGGRLPGPDVVLDASGAEMVWAPSSSPGGGEQSPDRSPVALLLLLLFLPTLATFAAWNARQASLRDWQPALLAPPG